MKGFLAADRAMWRLLAITILILTLPMTHRDSVLSVFAEGESIDFNIAIATLDSCDTLGGDYHCVVPTGSTFTTEVRLDKLGGLLDHNGNAVPEYTGPVAALHYTGGLAVEGSEWLLQEVACGSLIETESGSSSAKRFVIGASPSQCHSSFTGTLATVDFECPPGESIESITLVHGTDQPPFLAGEPNGGSRDTLLFNDDEGAAFTGRRVAASGSSETLIVECIDLTTVGGLAEVPSVTANEGFPMGNAIILAGLGAALLAAGGVAWPAWKRSRSSS